MKSIKGVTLPKGEYYIGGLDDLVNEITHWETVSKDSNSLDETSRVLEVNGAKIYYYPFGLKSGSAQQLPKGKLTKPSLDEVKLYLGEWCNLCFISVNDSDKLLSEGTNYTHIYKNGIIQLMEDTEVTISRGKKTKGAPIDCDPAMAQYYNSHFNAVIESDKFKAELYCSVD